MMRRMLDYLLLFLVVVVLQVFLFDNLDTGLYLHPMIYWHSYCCCRSRLFRYWCFCWDWLRALRWIC